MSDYMYETCAGDDEPNVTPFEFGSPSTTSVRNFTMLVCDPGSHLGTPVHVATQLMLEPMQIHSISKSEHVGDPRRFDVCLLDLSVGRHHALGIAGEICANDPTLECLFVTDDLASPATAAARSLGIRKIVTADQSISWWSSTLQALAELTNARRSLREAEQRVPPIPLLQPAEPARPLPLPEAERQFRTAYLSRLIHEHKSHKRAANQAGLPYTTLCSMLKKLRIG